MAHCVIMLADQQRNSKPGGFSMAVEIKETTEKSVDDSVENAVMGADLVTGAAVTVAENVSRTINHPVREARKIERRGAAANRRFSKDVAGFMEDTVEVIDA